MKRLFFIFTSLALAAWTTVAIFDTRLPNLVDFTDMVAIVCSLLSVLTLYGQKARSFSRPVKRGIFIGYRWIVHSPPLVPGISRHRAYSPSLPARTRFATVPRHEILASFHRFPHSLYVYPGKEYLDLFPRHTLVVIAGEGHSTGYERPGLVPDHILHFLDTTLTAITTPSSPFSPPHIFRR